MSYKVKSGGTLYWTATGNQAGTIPAGTILDLDGTPKTIKDRTMYKIILPLAYQGKYVELANLEAYIPPVETPEDSPTLPPPDEIEARWKNAAGEVIVTQLWIPKSTN